MSCDKPLAPTVTVDEAAEKLSIHVNPLMGHVGAGDGILIVYVTHSRIEARRLAGNIPLVIDGYPVKVQYVGKIRAAGSR